jgi:acylphosphatase
MDVRKRVLVSGRVQGVFFRATLRDVARGLGLVGWARNRPDGTVEAELQGRAAAVDEAIGFCRQGPPGARVADVAVRDLEPLDGEGGFAVR